MRSSQHWETVVGGSDALVPTLGNDDRRVEWARPNAGKRQSEGRMSPSQRWETVIGGSNGLIPTLGNGGQRGQCWDFALKKMLVGDAY